ncbi:MAG: MmgE/PrpD family protein [Rhodoferax sp.]
MTDATPVIDRLAALCQDFALPAASAQGQAHARALLLDTLGCALAARSHAAVVKAAVAAQALAQGDAATGLGSGRRRAVLGAILDTGAAIRALDFNDFYWGPGIGGHPSDLFAVSLALAESTQADLGQLLEATIVGYALYLRLLDRMAPDGAFDHTTAMTLGAAAIAARLGRLDRSATGHALAMALVRGPSLSAMRHGAISEAKATAPAVAAISGVIAAQLAQAGISGPVAACLGPVGLAGWLGPEQDIAGLAGPGPLDAHLLGVSIKRFPCIGTAQAAVAGALALREQARALGASIRSVDVQLVRTALIEHQTSAAYARPRDRETADHSFFSLLALALCDGDLQPAQFAARRYGDADVVDMSTRLRFGYELQRRAPGLFPARLEATLDDGRRITADVPYPPGHPQHPLDRAALLAKWQALTADCLAPATAHTIAELCLHAPASHSVSDLIHPLALAGRSLERTA